MAVQPGDLVTFPISKTLTGVGTVRSITKEGAVVIVRAGRSYFRQPREVIVSTATSQERRD
jgi:hypothetical protein